MKDQEITLRGFSVESTEIKISEARYREASADEMLDLELDVYLSDMDGETFVIEPDGTVVSPYGREPDLMALLRPILDAVPAWQVEQYAASRRADEE